MAESGTAAARAPLTNAKSEDNKWQRVLDLPCRLTIELPLPGFTVGDLVRMQAEAVMDSRWPAGEDVPVRVNGQLIAWSEFEVVGNRLAVRVTELQ